MRSADTAIRVAAAAAAVVQGEWEAAGHYSMIVVETHAAAVGFAVAGLESAIDALSLKGHAVDMNYYLILYMQTSRWLQYE